VGTENTDGEGRAEESGRGDADEPVVTPDVAPPDAPDGETCVDPGPGRDPRPDLRGA
jgi:hypothetical protein